MLKIPGKRYGFLLSLKYFLRSDSYCLYATLGLHKMAEVCWAAKENCHLAGHLLCLVHLPVFLCTQDSISCTFAGILFFLPSPNPLDMQEQEGLSHSKKDSAGVGIPEPRSCCPRLHHSAGSSPCRTQKNPVALLFGIN